METFGRSRRATVCAAETRSEPTLSQTLHLISGDTVNQKLADSRVVADLLASGATPAAIIEDLYGHQRDLAANILQHANGADPDVDAWIAGRPQTAQRVETLIADLRKLGGLDLAKLAVANRELRSLSGG